MKARLLTSVDDDSSRSQRETSTKAQASTHINIVREKKIVELAQDEKEEIFCFRDLLTID